MGWEKAEGSGKWKKITDAEAKRYISDHVKRIHGFESKQAIDSITKDLIKKNGREMLNISSNFTQSSYIRYHDDKRKE